MTKNSLVQLLEELPRYDAYNVMMTLDGHEAKPTNINANGKWMRYEDIFKAFSVISAAPLLNWTCKNGLWTAPTPWGTEYRVSDKQWSYSQTSSWFWVDSDDAAKAAAQADYEMRTYAGVTTQIARLQADNEALKSVRDMLGGYWEKAEARAKAAEEKIAARDGECGAKTKIIEKLETAIREANAKMQQALHWLDYADIEFAEAGIAADVIRTQAAQVAARDGECEAKTKIIEKLEIVVREAKEGWRDAETALSTERAKVVKLVEVVKRVGQARLLLDTGAVRMSETMDYVPATILHILAELDAALSEAEGISHGADFKKTSTIEGLEEWESEEAAKRAASFEEAGPRIAKKSEVERKRHVALGWIDENGQPIPNARQDETDDE